MARAKKKVAEIHPGGEITSSNVEALAASIPSLQSKTPARQTRVTRPRTSPVPIPSSSINDPQTRPAKGPALRKTVPAVEAVITVEVDPPVSQEAVSRRPPEPVESMEVLRREVADLRTMLASFRIEIEQARCDLKDAVLQNTVVLNTDVNSARDSIATLGQEVRQQLAGLANLIREAREQSKNLTQHLGEIRVSVTQQGDELRSRLQSDRQEWNGVGRELELIVSRLRQEVEKASRVVQPPAKNQQIEDQSPVREASSPPAIKESSSAEIGHNRLGITVGPGIVVTEVIAGTPGEAAGLELGDVIDGINGLPVRSGPELREAILTIPLGDDVVLTIWRSGAVFELKTRMTGVTSEQDDPISEVPPSLGVTVEDGAVVSEVLPFTSASSAGLQRGDVVTSINSESVTNGEQLRRIIQPLQYRADVKLQITRGTEVLEMQLQLDEAGQSSDEG